MWFMPQRTWKLSLYIDNLFAYGNQVVPEHLKLSLLVRWENLLKVSQTPIYHETIYSVFGCVFTPSYLLNMCFARGYWIMKKRPSCEIFMLVHQMSYSRFGGSNVETVCGISLLSIIMVALCRSMVNLSVLREYTALLLVHISSYLLPFTVERWEYWEDYYSWLDTCFCIDCRCDDGEKCLLLGWQLYRIAVGM